MNRLVGFVMRRRATVVGAIVLAVVVGGTALGAARGSYLRMGVANVLTGNYVTSFAGTVSSALVYLRNLSSATASSALRLDAPYGGTPLDLRARSGQPPMRVNSGARVTYLNADKLDGLDAAAFLRATGKAADSDMLDGMDSTGFARGGGTVVSRTSSIMVAGTTETLDLHDLGQIAITCNANYTWTTAFTAGFGPADTWVDAGGADPSYQRITVGTTRSFSSAANDRVVWDITSRSFTAASISISLLAPNPTFPGRCDYSAIGLVRNNP
jgi:hypothetical protein